MRVRKGWDYPLLADYCQMMVTKASMEAVLIKPDNKVTIRV